MPQKTPTASRNFAPSAWVLGCILIVYVLIAAQYSRRFEGNWSGFACIGDRFKAPHRVTGDTFVFKNSDGYDGQFFFFASFDPLLLHGNPDGMDVPAYRCQRLLYPLLAHAFAFGHPERIPFFLVAINIFAIFLGSVAIVCWLRDRNLSPGWAFSYAFTGGFALCLFRDLPEPLAMSLLVCGLYAYQKERFGWAALFLSLMLLTRETLLVVNACVLIAAVAKKSGRELFWGLCSLVPFAAWQVFLFHRFHDFAFRGGKNNFGKPFDALWHYFSQTFSEPGHLAEKGFAALFLFVMGFAVLMALFEFLRTRTVLTGSFLIYAVQPFFMTGKVWVEPWSYARVLLPLFVFLILNFIASGGRGYAPALLANILLFLVTLVWEPIW